MTDVMTDEQRVQAGDLGVEVQWAVAVPDAPTAAQLAHWAQQAAADCTEPTELVLRVVDEHESGMLNMRYRQRPGATNVLSFPFDPLPHAVQAQQPRHLGDIVICAAVVAREAKQQGKPLPSHWAHMVVHGVLHLLGYDHMDANDARLMEAHETRLLTGLGFEAPYEPGREIEA